MNTSSNFIWMGGGVMPPLVLYTNEILPWWTP